MPRTATAQTPKALRLKPSKVDLKTSRGRDRSRD